MPNIDAYMKNVHADVYRARGEAMGTAARRLGDRITRRFRRPAGDGVTTPRVE